MPVYIFATILVLHNVCLYDNNACIVALSPATDYSEIVKAMVIIQAAAVRD